MKKRILLTLMLCLLAGALTLGVSAAGVLSSGTAVIAEETGMIKGGIAGERVPFSAADFKQAMGKARFKSITLTSLPDAECGVLYFGEAPATAGMTVPRESLSSLCFVPKDKSVKEAVFRFTAEGIAGGAEMVCTVRLAEKLNAAPTVNEEGAFCRVSTFTSQSAEGTLSASDPEGDALEFIVIEYPKRGVLTMTDPARGDFRYTPTAAYVGRDSFTFVVRDTFGNYSAPARVEVSVSKNTTGLVFADLLGSATALPAIALGDAGIMTGTLVGDGMYFAPDAAVSRGEFLVMAMKAAGIVPREGLLHTVFDDDAAIPEGLCPYVATAQEAGLIVGTLSEEGLVFLSDEEITRGEAAILLARCLGLKSEASATLGEAMPSLVGGATAALLRAGIYPRDDEGLLSVGERLDRAAAAEMLYAAMLYVK